MTDRSTYELTTSISWLAHLIERFSNMRLAAGSFPEGMSYARANLILAVHAAHEDGHSAKMIDIALDLGVTARTLTTIVDALERQDLLKRAADPSDRRAWQLVLTDSGKELVPELLDALAQASETVSAPLSGDEQAQFTRLLNKLIDRGGE